MFICVFPRAFCACKRSDSVCASDRCLISYFGPCQPNTKNNTKIRRLNNDKHNTDFTYGKNLINFIIFFISLVLKNDWFLYVALFITEKTVFRTLKMMSWKFLSVKNNSTVCIVFSGSIQATSFWFEFTKLSNILAKVNTKNGEKSAAEMFHALIRFRLFPLGALEKIKSDRIFTEFRR